MQLATSPRTNDRRYLQKHLLKETGYKECSNKHCQAELSFVLHVKLCWFLCSVLVQTQISLWFFSHQRFKTMARSLHWLLNYNWLHSSYDGLILTFNWFSSAGLKASWDASPRSTKLKNLALNPIHTGNCIDFAFFDGSSYGFSDTEH